MPFCWFCHEVAKTDRKLSLWNDGVQAKLADEKEFKKSHEYKKDDRSSSVYLYKANSTLFGICQFNWPCTGSHPVNFVLHYHIPL